MLVLIGRFAAVVSVHLYNSDFDGGNLIPGTALFIYVNDWGLVLLMRRNKVCDYKILKASCIIRVTHSKYHYSLTTKLILLSSTCYNIFTNIQFQLRIHRFSLVNSGENGCSFEPSVAPLNLNRRSIPW